jgi:hypothetical protein
MTDKYMGWKTNKGEKRKGGNGTKERIIGIIVGARDLCMSALLCLQKMIKLKKAKLSL